MSSFQANREVIFSGIDLSRSRWTVEHEKLARFFPSIQLYGVDGRVTSAQGYLSTSYGSSYYVNIEIGQRYPYVLPRVCLPYTTVDSACPHRYSDGSICVMKSEQWSSSLSLAFLVAKTAVWLNKYDNWLRTGRTRWPGKGQPH
jgi:hypothetical protein